MNLLFSLVLFCFSFHTKKLTLTPLNIKEKNYNQGLENAEQKLMEIVGEVHEITQWNPHSSLFTFAHLYFLNFQEKDFVAAPKVYLCISILWSIIHLHPENRADTLIW